MGSIDLIYLDPPFNSNATYNMLFQEPSGEKSAAQISAFEDTWKWGPQGEEAFDEAVMSGPPPLAELLKALRQVLGCTNMLAYLSMMAVRLVEMHRALKPSGNLFLHCDPTASHYIKLILDNIFSPKNFRNEIIWERSQPKGHTTTRFSRAHDTIFFYSKSEKSVFNPQFTEHDPAYLERFYRHVEPETGRRYRLGDLTNPNKERPNLTYEFPPGSGTMRVWRWTQERMLQAWAEGRVVIPEGGVAQYKRYLDEMSGTLVKDIWYDIEHLHGSIMNTWATRPRNRRPCWNASSGPGATRAMWSWTPFAAAAPRWRWLSISSAAGLASTSLIWPSTLSGRGCKTPSKANSPLTKKSGFPGTCRAPRACSSLTLFNLNVGPWPRWGAAAPGTREARTAALTGS